jgi:hypothetical protein
VENDTTKTSAREAAYEPPPSPLSARVDSGESGNSGNSGSSGETYHTIRPAANHPAIDDGWDERNVVVPRSNLTVLDVAALILNKMVGS